MSIKNHWCKVEENNPTLTDENDQPRMHEYLLFIKEIRALAAKSSLQEFYL
jgi:hypothetical protein